MPLDGLPPIFGALEIAGGMLLFIGLFTRPTALILCCELLVAYFYLAMPRSVWPIRNGGDEVLLYLLVFIYFGVRGAGTWSWDDLRRKGASRELMSASAGKTADISLLKYGFRSREYSLTISGQITSMLYTSMFEEPVPRNFRNTASRC